MPVYNGAKTLDRAVNSILNQTYQNWQLLILDDGSVDETVLMTEKFRDPRIKLLKDGQHKGIVVRLNEAIEIADGFYFARMDADDFSYPERLSKQIAFLEEHPSVDVVGTAIRLVNGSNHKMGYRHYPTYHAAITATPWLKTISMAHPTWCGRSAWFKHWRYREFAKNEDQELLLRAHRSSIYANLPEVLLDYYMSASFRKSLISRWGNVRLIHHYYTETRQLHWYIIGLFIVFIKFFRDFFIRK